MRLIPQPESIEVFSGTTELSHITKREIADNFTSDEEYELKIEPDAITACASGEKGLYYAEVTFRQIKAMYKNIPCMIVRDKPRFSHRGFMIDCARHMFTVAQLKKMISVASDVKLNKLHWHLSDDQGFRIELDSLPELTKKGSVRKCDNFINCKSDKEYSGYYTKAEIREIVEFCKERYIDIIPELDMPGHQSAFLHVYPEFTCTGDAVEVKCAQGIFKDIICASNEKAREYLKKILDEITELFPYDTVHIGGDEVPKFNWKSCDSCQKMMKDNGLSDENELQVFFINLMAAYLKEKGKKAVVWNDCLKGKGLNRDIIIQHWQKGVKRTADAVNSGHSLILSPFTPYYADYPYGMHPLKAVYKFEPEKFRGLDRNGKGNIAGVESPVWTEHISTDERLEYMCFPRWFAVAECGWTSKKNRSYAEFEDAVKTLCEYYNAQGLHPAPESDWNPSLSSRLGETLKFFMPKK